MKKIKKSMLIVAIFSVVIISATGCDKKTVMNADKCAEVALEYMENKYQKDFEVVDSRQMRKYIGSDNYARVIVKIKGEEEEYWIILFPDGDKDIDNDGYYDSYKVISDDYMSELVKQNILKREFDTLSNTASFILEYFLCFLFGSFKSDFDTSPSCPTIISKKYHTSSFSLFFSSGLFFASGIAFINLSIIPSLGTTSTPSAL